jgi:CoA:oxalate CoA-transferase
MSGLLEGVKVLDLTRVLAGPYCCMMLADMGADVIKIEMPGRGDDSRHNAPIVKGGESAYFLNLNRNKRGITLNLKTEEGKQILRDLVKRSDILVENYRPGVMDRLGLGYERLKEINPALVYGAVSGFGQYGPYSKRPGYDILGQAMSGLMSTTGWPGGAPTRTGTAISDVMGGVSVCVGILAAYINRLKTGIGEKVDVALVDSMVSSMEIINMIYLCTGRVPTRIGNRYEAIAPYDSFQSKDGYVIIACGNDKLFNKLKEVIKIPELEDERFTDNLKRVANVDALKPIIEDWTEKRTTDEICDLFLKAGIPAGPINTIDKVVNDPHIAGARQMFVECEHPIAGKITLTNTQLKFTNKPAGIRFPAPTLGQHNDEILKALGRSDKEIAEYKANGVI